MSIKLFENLSNRLRNENDLSDITWAFCETSHLFKSDFIYFFFPELESKNIINFERERSQNNSRADFYLKDNENNVYIIEAKIYDNNHHFEQYCETYEIDKKHLGYILNYEHNKENFETKTWTQLYEYLSIKKENLITDEEKNLYESYLAYLKNVCNIIHIYKRITLGSMYDLFTFSELLKRQLTFQKDNLKVEIYSRKLNDIRSGYDIKISKNNLIPDIWIWVGIYYNVENPIICFEIWNNEGWGKPFFEKIKLSSNNFNHNYSKPPYFEDDCYYFEMSDYSSNQFSNALHLEEQAMILNKFINEVIEFYE